MSRIILPQMLQRKKGVIINLSSAAGDTPVPLIALYSASKAYNNFLSLAMDMEYRDQGIIIQVWKCQTNLISSCFENHAAVMSLFLFSL